MVDRILQHITGALGIQARGVCAAFLPPCTKSPPHTPYSSSCFTEHPLCSTEHSSPLLCSTVHPPFFLLPPLARGHDSSETLSSVGISPPHLLRCAFFLAHSLTSPSPFGLVSLICLPSHRHLPRMSPSHTTQVLSPGMALDYQRGGFDPEVPPQWLVGSYSVPLVRVSLAAASGARCTRPCNNKCNKFYDRSSHSPSVACRPE